MNNYYPFGLTFNSYQRVTAKENKYNTFQDQEKITALDLNWIQFKWRNHDPTIGRFFNVDPLADIAPDKSPYHFVSNNPINGIDPTGLTDFKINKETGDVTQVGKANDDPDRVLKIDKDGNVKRKGEGFLGFLVSDKNQGKAKVAFRGVEKGILEDGQNFKSENNLIGVGGEGQPSEQGVEAFALNLSNYVGTEIGGAYFGDGIENTSHITLGMYKNNSHKQSRSSGHTLGLKNGLNLTGFFHTHPNGGNISNSDSLVPSDADLDFRDNALQLSPSLKFFLLIQPMNYGDRYPKKIPYTTGYSRRLR